MKHGKFVFLMFGIGVLLGAGLLVYKEIVSFIEILSPTVLLWTLLAILYYAMETKKLRRATERGVLHNIEKKNTPIGWVQLNSKSGKIQDNKICTQTLFYNNSNFPIEVRAHFTFLIKNKIKQASNLDLGDPYQSKIPVYPPPKSAFGGHIEINNTLPKPIFLKIEAKFINHSNPEYVSIMPPQYWKYKPESKNWSLVNPVKKLRNLKDKFSV